MKRAPAVLVLLSLSTLLALPAFAAADLILTKRPNVLPHTVPWGTGTTLEFDVYNSGPDEAQNVVVTIDYPPGLLLAEIFGSAAVCDTTKLPMRCTMGNVKSNQFPPNFFRVRVAAPSADTSITISASVTSDTPDSNPDNNAASDTWEVRNLAELYARNEGSLRVDPGTTVKLPTELLNFIPSTPTDIRIDYVATNGTIAKIDAPANWSCTIAADGAGATCRAPELNESCRCSGTIDVYMTTSSDRAGTTAKLVMNASSAIPQYGPLPATATAAVQTYRWIPVTNDADSGPGSLRAAIDRANGECDAAPCKIAFEIPGPVPAAGWYTIQPATPLPEITAKFVNLDGATQTAFTGDTNPLGPEVAIDGRFTTEGYGLVTRSGCESVIAHLAIGNFRDHGVYFTTTGNGGTCPQVAGYNVRAVSGNYLGADPTGTQPWPNLRGIRADDALFATIANNVIRFNRLSGVWMWRGAADIGGNTIDHNGASGIFLGPQVTFGQVLFNTIRDNREMGVAIARGAQQADVRGNRMSNNGGLGIDIGLDGRDATDDTTRENNAPVLLSAVYDEAKKQTLVTLTLTTQRAGGATSSLINFYANDAPDGDGEVPAGDNYTTTGRNEPFTIALDGDYRGKWLNATSTFSHILFSEPPVIRTQNLPGATSSTSELSNAVHVQ